MTAMTSTPTSALRATPQMPETTPRAIRIPDDLWAAALEKAQAEGTTVTAVVLKALERFIKKP